MADDEEPKPTRVQIDVVLDDALAQGMYVNLARIYHTQAEFVLDALFLPPQSLKATVRSRLILSPAHARSLHQALGQNLAMYEQKFGVIGGEEIAVVLMCAPRTPAPKSL